MCVHLQNILESVYDFLYVRSWSSTSHSVPLLWLDVDMFVPLLQLAVLAKNTEQCQNQQDEE